MNKVLRGALGVVVALAVMYGVRGLRQTIAGDREPTAAELKGVIDDVRERAMREHPDMAQTDAMKQVVAADSTKKLAGKSPQQQAMTAAEMFWGFYYMNTKARAAYCTARGVDLTPFVSVFAKVHGAEFAKAQAIFAADNSDPEELLPKLMPAFAPVVEQDMKDVTAGANTPLDQACALFNENAQQLADFIQLPPAVKQALMANY